MAHNAVLFFVNGATRDLLYDPEVSRPIRDAFIAGANVGVIASILESPVDLLKCKLQATKEYSGVFSAARSLYSRFGLPGLWQGFGGECFFPPLSIGAWAILTGFPSTISYGASQRSLLFHVFWVQLAVQRVFQGEEWRL